jgi:hypothetical protein
MTSLPNRSRRQVLDPLIRKLRSLGVERDTELEAVLNRIKVRAGTRRGEDIIAPGKSSRHSTLLLAGVAACMSVSRPATGRSMHSSILETSATFTGMCCRKRTMTLLSRL